MTAPLYDPWDEFAVWLEDWWRANIGVNINFKDRETIIEALMEMVDPEDIEQAKRVYESIVEKIADDGEHLGDLHEFGNQIIDNFYDVAPGPAKNGFKPPSLAGADDWRGFWHALNNLDSRLTGDQIHRIVEHFIAAGYTDANQAYRIMADLSGGLSEAADLEFFFDKYVSKGDSIPGPHLGNFLETTADPKSAQALYDALGLDESGYLRRINEIVEQHGGKNPPGDSASWYHGENVPLKNMRHENLWDELVDLGIFESRSDVWDFENKVWNIVDADEREMRRVLDAVEDMAADPIFRSKLVGAELRDQIGQKNFNEIMEALQEGLNKGYEQEVAQKDYFRSFDAPKDEFVSTLDDLVKNPDDIQRLRSSAVFENLQDETFDELTEGLLKKNALSKKEMDALLDEALGVKTPTWKSRLARLGLQAGLFADLATTVTSDAPIIRERWEQEAQTRMDAGMPENMAWLDILLETLDKKGSTSFAPAKTLEGQWERAVFGRVLDSTPEQVVPYDQNINLRGKIIPEIGFQTWREEETQVGQFNRMATMHAMIQGKPTSYSIDPQGVATGDPYAGQRRSTGGTRKSRVPAELGRSAAKTGGFQEF